MIFKEPKVEVVEIDLKSSVATTSGEGTGSGEDCQGSDASSNNCAVGATMYHG